MKVSVEWLQDYLGKKLSATDMATALEQAGVEVEEIISSKPLDPKIVVGLVKKVAQHPNADKLHLAEVEIGRTTVHVVCGAPNLAEGQHVAVAQEGSVLPDGTKLKAAEIRGQKSHGMICSAHELGLGDDHSGIMVLGNDAKPGRPVAEMMSQGEAIDLTTAANRWDLQSVIGLAREIAAQTDIEMVLPKLREIASIGETLKVRLESDKVLRYMLQRFSIDVSHPTAAFAKRRLQGSGSRPINIAVDTTNYVLHEYGQPLHAFDADKVKLPITVRMAKKGEKLVTLDEVERTLTPQDMVIADASGAIALAGVMGGMSTAVSDTTTSILIESATFDAVTVRKTALRHGLRTDASARYERGLPVELAALGLQRAGDIIAAAVGGESTSKRFDSLKSEPRARSLSLRQARVESLLGMPVASALVKERLERLGFECSGEDVMKIQVPWWRGDVTLEEDLIEEVGRSLGYDDLPATLPPWHPEQVTFDRRQAKIWDLKAALRALGLFEVVTYSFVSADQLEGVGYHPDEHLKLKNPLSSEQEYLRSSLLPSLLTVTAKNVRYSNDFGVFEISRVFDAPMDRSRQPEEPTHLAVMRRTGFNGARESLDLLARQLNIKPTVTATEVVGLHPHRSAHISLHGEVIGVMGEVHPAISRAQKISGSVSFVELDVDALIAASQDVVYKPISRYPSTSRDIAVIIQDRVSWADVTRALKGYNLEYVSEYRGQDIPTGSRSLAMRLTFVSPERTLTDAEAEAGVAQALEILKNEFKATLRA